jgi:hypothetical protein
LCVGGADVEGVVEAFIVDAFVYSICGERVLFPYTKHLDTVHVVFYNRSLRIKSHLHSLPYNHPHACVLATTVINLISIFSLSHYTTPASTKEVNDDDDHESHTEPKKKKREVRMSKPGWNEDIEMNGLTTLLDQYMSLSITARTAATLSASAMIKLPFIVPDSGSDNGPAISVHHTPQRVVVIKRTELKGRVRLTGEAFCYVVFDAFGMFLAHCETPRRRVWVGVVWCPDDECLFCGCGGVGR